MNGFAKVGIVLVVAAVGGGFGAKHYFELLKRAEANQLDASKALMQSEELVWSLEGECLKDAQRVLAMPDAKTIASEGDGAKGDEEKMKAEHRLRAFLRIRRAPGVLKVAERAFVTMTNESRAATNDAAITAGLRPVDVLAEWMTFEGASDLALMTNVFENREKLRATAGAQIDTFFPANAEAPSGKKGVRIIDHKDDRIEIDLFGARVIEEWVKGKAVAITGEGKAKITWKSNYNFLRDLVAGKTPEPELEETLVQTDEGFGVDYRDWIKEYLDGGDKLPWATVLCLKGPLAAGALKQGKEDKPEGGDKAPAKGGEKAVDKSDKAPEHGEK